MHGAWQNSNDDIPNMGSKPVPYGIAQLFRQCSSFVNKKEGWEYRVSTDYSPTDVSQPVLDWPLDLAYIFNTPDVTFNVITTTVTVLTSAQMNFVAHLIDSVYPSSVMVNDLVWGARTPELFVGAGGTSHAMIYPWSQICSLLRLGDTQFQSYLMLLNSTPALQIVLWSFLFSCDDKFTTLAHCLRSNEFDPVMFAVVPLLYDTQYAAQVIDKTFSETGIPDDADYFNFNQVCWSYIAAFLPVVTAMLSTELLPNVQFRKWKMPFPIQCLAKQMAFRSGSVYYYPAFSSTNLNFSSVHAGANTGLFVGFGTPGYVSASVPSDPSFGGVTWTAGLANPSFLSNSWTYASEGYRLMQHIAISGLQSVLSDKDVDCGCSVITATTDNGLVRSNSVLGNYIVRCIRELYCPAPLSQGLCGVASSLTWRSAFSPGASVAAINKNYVTKNDQTDGSLSTLVSYAVSPSLTSVQVLQASKQGISSYVKDQVSGGYDYTFVEPEDILKFVSDVATNSPLVQRVTGYAADRLVSLLPQNIPLDEVTSLAMALGTGGAALLAKVLSNRRIGFPVRRLTRTMLPRMIRQTAVCLLWSPMLLVLL